MQEHEVWVRDDTFLAWWVGAWLAVAWLTVMVTRSKFLYPIRLQAAQSWFWNRFWSCLFCVCLRHSILIGWFLPGDTFVYQHWSVSILNACIRIVVLHSLVYTAFSGRSL